MMQTMLLTALVSLAAATPAERPAVRLVGSARPGTARMDVERLADCTQVALQQAKEIERLKAALQEAKEKTERFEEPPPPPPTTATMTTTPLPLRPHPAAARRGRRANPDAPQPGTFFKQTVPHWTPFHDFFHNLDQQRHHNPCTGCVLPLAHKWESYFAPYHKHFARYRGKKVTFMEVGVQSGGSIAMWRWYFGPGLTYIGVDINPRTQMFGSDWAHIFIGSQSDRGFWAQMKPKVEALGGVDIFLDDGGHTMDMQKITFSEMFPVVKPNGIYACEDLATSYFPNFGGNHNPAPANKPRILDKTFVGSTMKWVDWLHSVFYAKPSAANALAERFQREVQSIHYYQQIVLLEKAPGNKFPGTIKVGDFSFDYKPKPWDGKFFPMDQAVENITAALSNSPTRDLAADAYWDGKPHSIHMDDEHTMGLMG